MIGILLDSAAIFIVSGIVLSGIYEAIAVIDHIRGGTIPRITDIVRPWAMQHKMVFLAIAALIFASFFWLFFHFVLPA